MALIQREGRRLVVTSAMTADFVCALLAEAQPLLDGDVEVDLAQVGEVDSTSISLMFEWLRQAHARNASVVYINVPDTLISLSTLYGVLDFIPQRAAAAH
jgi:phospholipid transport system transporter-binding protein